MTTVAVIVKDAMLAARVIGIDQTVASGDGDLVLRRLNRMLDSWSNETQMIYASSTQSFLMTGGTAQYSTTLLSGRRPVAISSMRVSLSGIDYPVNMIDEQTWNAITFKQASSIPLNCFYDATFPDGSLNFYPVPYGAFTCYVDCQAPLSTVTLAMATDLTLPEGYESAIVAGLAVDISPSFGKQATPAMLEEMKQTRAVLKRTNYQPLLMVTPFDHDNDISNAFPYRTF
jgi:hypothetical protein